MTPRPSVWLVDDLPANLATFKKNHGDAFDIRTFSNPTQVLEQLKHERPNALLCDVFFYESEERAKDIETRVLTAAQDLRSMAHSIGADSDQYLGGIVLMEAIAEKYGGSVPFTVYAYTSKGPYILDQPTWDRILTCGAKPLLKNRFGRQTEQVLIQRDINIEKQRNSWRTWVIGHVYSVFITGGLLSALVGAIIGWFLCRHFP